MSLSDRSGKKISEEKDACGGALGLRNNEWKKPALSNNQARAKVCEGNRSRKGFNTEN